MGQLFLTDNLPRLHTKFKIGQDIFFRYPNGAGVTSGVIMAIELNDSSSTLVNYLIKPHSNQLRQETLPETLIATTQDDLNPKVVTDHSTLESAMERDPVYKTPPIAPTIPTFSIGQTVICLNDGRLDFWDIDSISIDQPVTEPGVNEVPQVKISYRVTRVGAGTGNEATIEEDQLLSAMKNFLAYYDELFKTYHIDYELVVSQPSVINKIMQPEVKPVETQTDHYK